MIFVQRHDALLHKTAKPTDTVHVNSQCACCECVPCAAVKMIHSIAIIKVPLCHDCSRIFCADTHAEFLGISHTHYFDYLQGHHLPSFLPHLFKCVRQLNIADLLKVLEL